jgi:hypothetical protein
MLLFVPSYNIEITQHKHTNQSQQNQSRQPIEKGWFIILDFLWLYDKKDMACGLWLVRYDFDSFNGKFKCLEINDPPRYNGKNLYAL